MLSFQKLGPLLLEWVAIVTSIKEWSVLYPVAILVDLGKGKNPRDIEFLAVFTATYIYDSPGLGLAMRPLNQIHHKILLMF